MTVVISTIVALFHSASGDILSLFKSMSKQKISLKFSGGREVNKHKQVLLSISNFNKIID